ncbi:MAG TPA: zinc-binding dehydrogenase, partial [Mycobacteriales bacterium]|nr:zinc-binding dehydrogenase [Mycobacteriales bacterium]
TAGVRPGQSLTVFGLGGVGLAAVLTAVAAGAFPVIAVDPMPAKRELALRLGATQAMSPEECTAGMSEFAIEAVGSARALQAAYAAVERGGVAVAVGLPHPDEQLTIPALSLAGEGKSLKGSYLGDSAPHRDIPRLISLWRGGRLPVEQLASQTIGLDRINEAFDDLAAAATVRTLIDPHH